MALILLLGSAALADTPQQISVTVDGVTYSCVGSGSQESCAGAGAAFQAQLEYCYKQYSGGYCAQTLWPAFKKNYPQCAYAGVKPCIDYCYKQYSGGYCAEMCS